MTTFRMLLIAAWIALSGYTGWVVSAHGLNLLPVFFGDIAKGIWPGQFNVDFLCFLMLSAMWTAWRNRFTPIGLLLGAVAFVGGAGFLLPYLLVLSVRLKGNIPHLLLGETRARLWLDQGR